MPTLDHVPTKPAPKKLRDIRSGTDSKIVLLWKEHMQKHHPYPGQFGVSPKDRGKLKLLYNALGEETGETLVWAISHWNEFTANVRKQRGEEVSPAIPVPGYLLVHALMAKSLRHELALRQEEEIAMQKEKAELLASLGLNPDVTPKK